MGGALADPCNNYPTLFARGTIFDRFPYLLPNIICTVVLVCGVTIGILFLEETHEKKKHRRDMGLEAGKWILDRFQGVKMRPLERYSKAAEANLPEYQILLEEDEQPPGYRSVDGMPRPSTSRSSMNESKKRSGFAAIDTPRQTPSVEKTFTKQVILHIIGYGLLA